MLNDLDGFQNSFKAHQKKIEKSILSKILPEMFNPSPNRPFKGPCSRCGTRAGSSACSPKVRFRQADVSRTMASCVTCSTRRCEGMKMKPCCGKTTWDGADNSWWMIDTYWYHCYGEFLNSCCGSADISPNDWEKWYQFNQIVAKQIVEISESGCLQVLDHPNIQYITV